MSRAIDKSGKEALKNENHEKVFADLSALFSHRHDDLLELEILPSSHQLQDGQIFLQDGSAVAIPKIRLLQAFIAARQAPTDLAQVAEKWDVEQALAATAVMLAMDPENLTAANNRKRVITKQLLPSLGEDALHREKYFVDSLLTSRLHRHTKSPTLWSHRRWLMEQFRDAGLGVDIVDDLKRVIFVSGERHPRNYYAWMHARYLVERFELAQASQDSQQPLYFVVEDTKKWCFAHHNDVSGWSFLSFLLRKWPEYAEDVLSQTMTLTGSFHWRNESVWHFLRIMIGREDAESSFRLELRQLQNELMQELDDDSPDRKTLKQAIAWVERWCS